MSENITVEKKLQLVQQLRSQYNRNLYDLNNRERILYGKESSAALNHVAEEPPADSVKSTFLLRMMLAVVLLGILLFLNASGKTLFGFTPAEISQCISMDFTQAIMEQVF